MLDQLLEMIQTQFANNDLFAGGAILMVAGGLFAIVRNWPAMWWGWIKKQCMVVIDIPDTDAAFEWITTWLAQDTYSKSRARLLTVKTERDNKKRDDPRPQIIFSPAPGTHYLWYKRRFMILTRQRNDPTEGNSGPTTRAAFREYFTIRLLGRGRQIALELLEEAREVALPKQERRIQIKQVGFDGEWFDGTNSRIRPIDTIILPQGRTDYFLNDMKMFLDSKDWYVQRGIPYRRTYMFYGPPGNGKSSAIIALATEMNFDIGNINLRKSDLNDSDLFNAIAHVPPHTLLLMEDIDCVAHGREMASDVTFSGLLNALDGVGSPEGQIVIMTTNHLEALDPALIRPGRCDLKVEFKNGNTYQQEQMFLRFYPESDLAVRFAATCPDDVSMAQLQGHFLTHRDNPEQAIEKSHLIKDGV